MSGQATVTIRAFIAIETDPELRESLTRIQRDLARLEPAARWVEPSTMHLTLAFLGNIEPACVAPLSHVMDGIGLQTHGFTLDVVGLGAFGPPRAPRVVWIGICGQTDALLRLQERARAAAKSLGILLDDKPFHPHLTLARLRPGRRAAAGFLDALACGAKRRFGQIQVQAIALIRSTLMPHGPEYTVLHRSLLCEAPLS